MQTTEETTVCDHSISAQEQGGGSSLTSSSATESSAPSNGMNSARPSCAPVSETDSCPHSPSSTTSEPSTVAPGAGQLTFLPAEFLAKASPAPVSNSENSTPETSGPTLCASCGNVARPGSSSKTWTALHRSTIGVSFSKTLRRLGTMLAGVCSPPEMWVLPTCVSGFGFSLPTPKATDGTHGGPNQTQHGKPGLSNLANRWPTPTASDGHGAGINQHTATLDREVKRQSRWPTPRCADGMSHPLRDPATIQAADAERGRTHPSRLEDAVSVARWPTPRANDAEKRGQLAPDPRNGLPMAVQWATPQARDHRSGKSSAATHDKNSQPLSEQVGDLLNPTWVEWLMGWPIDWTKPPTPNAADGGPSKEDFRAWLESNRTALTAFVDSAMVKWPSVVQSPSNSSVVE